MTKEKTKKPLEPSADKKQEATKRVLQISYPNFQMLTFMISGITPYMQNKMSNKAKEAIQIKMEAGSTKQKERKVRTPRNYEEDLRNAMHISTEGWHGVNASAFRKGMIDACRTVGFAMTLAKMCVFCEADGYDAEGTPLVKIEGKYERSDMAVRIDNGSLDIRIRPRWPKWKMAVRIRFDADQFTQTDVVNLMTRLGLQVGIGEGRPYGKDGTGIGYGLFRIDRVVQDAAPAAGESK